MKRGEVEVKGKKKRGGKKENVINLVGFNALSNKLLTKILLNWGFIRLYVPWRCS